MSAERGWIAEPQPARQWHDSHYSREARSPTTKRMIDHWHGVEEWAAHHRGQGHHPHPAPTPDNPEKWECDCGIGWRILTIEQTRPKFAHLRKRPTFGDIATFVVWAERHLPKIEDW